MILALQCKTEAQRFMRLGEGVDFKQINEEKDQIEDGKDEKG